MIFIPLTICFDLNGSYHFSFYGVFYFEFLFHGVILHKQTDKTMAELEIDINMRIREWDVIQVRDALQLLQFISRSDVLPILSVYSKD